MQSTEPSNLSLAVHGLIWIAGPYVSYFIGIIINNAAWANTNSISLRNQMLLGIPCSLVISSIYVATYLQRLYPSIDLTYAITMGIIMFNGFSVTNVADQFKTKYSTPPQSPDVPTSHVR